MTSHYDIVYNIMKLYNFEFIICAVYYVINLHVIDSIYSYYTCWHAQDHNRSIYCIAGNFGKVFNLVNWGFYRKSPNLNPPYFILTKSGDIMYTYWDSSCRQI